MPPRLMNQMEFAHLFELVEKWFWAVLILVVFLNAAALIPCDCEVAERCNNEFCLFDLLSFRFKCRETSKGSAERLVLLTIHACRAGIRSRDGNEYCSRNS